MAVCKAYGATITPPAEVDIGSVEKELSNLWKKAAEGGIPGVTAPIARTLLSNVVVYASSDEEADAAMAVITEMAADHPSRAVIADVQPGVPEEQVRAEVSMLCSISERGRRLCGEEIRLHAHGAAVAALGSIMPFLVPDLPVYLWTPGDIPAVNDVLKQLVHTADHWIIDSRKYSSRVSAFDTAKSLAYAYQPPVLLHDLAWVPVSQRCAAIAMHFDPHSAREHLRGIHNVEINYRQIGEIKPGMEPVLVAAWLIHQLKWRLQDVKAGADDSWSIAAISDAGDVSIILKPAAESASVIGEVVIESAYNGKNGVFRTTQSPQEDEIILEGEASDINSYRRSVRLTPGSACNEIRQVLDYPDRDMLYKRILPAIMDLLQKFDSVSSS